MREAAVSRLPLERPTPASACAVSRCRSRWGQRRRAGLTPPRWNGNDSTIMCHPAPGRDPWAARTTASCGTTHGRGGLCHGTATADNRAASRRPGEGAGATTTNDHGNGNGRRIQTTGDRAVLSMRCSIRLRQRQRQRHRSARGPTSPKGNGVLQQPQCAVEGNDRGEEAPQRERQHAHARRDR